MFNAHDMQDGLWENYQEDLETGYTSLEWEAYVNASIAHLIAMEEIKEVR